MSVVQSPGCDCEMGELFGEGGGGREREVCVRERGGSMCVCVDYIGMLLLIPFVQYGAFSFIKWREIYFFAHDF